MNKLKKTIKLTSLLAVMLLLLGSLFATPVFAEESDGETGDSEQVVIVLVSSNTANSDVQPENTISAEHPQYGYSNISLSSITTGILWGASFIIGTLLFLQYRRDKNQIDDMKVYYNIKD